MENESKILKEIQQSNQAVLSLIAKQNKTIAVQHESLKNDLAGIHKAIEIVTKKVEHVEQATLENRIETQSLNTNLKRIAHNHEARITRLENEITA